MDRSAMYTSLSNRFEYKIKGYGTDFVDAKQASQQIFASTYSDFFDIRENWSPEDLRDFCDDVYVNQIRQHVAMRLVDRMNEGWEIRNRDDSLVTALNSVFYSGDLNNYDLKGHSFNITKARKIRANADKVDIVGRFEHNSNETSCRNEEIDYRCSWEDGQKLIQKIKFGRTSESCLTTWQAAAKTFVEEICYQGYLEFRRPSQKSRKTLANTKNLRASAQYDTAGFEDL